MTYPQDWHKVTVGDLVEPYGGLTGKRKDDFESGRSPYITYMDVYSQPIINRPSGNVRIKSSENQNSVATGDLLFTQSSETPDEVGKVATYIGPGQPFLNSFCFGASPKTQYDPRFLVYFLSHGAPRQGITLLAQGSTRYNLSPRRLLGLEIIIPAIVEQRAIAEVLSGFDEHLSNLDELIAKKKAIRDGALNELVTGRMRLQDDGGEWTATQLKAVLLDLKTGGTPATAISRYWGGTIPWLASTGIHQRIVVTPTRYITREGLANSSAQMAPAHSILIALAGQGKTRGTAAVLQKPMALNQSLAALIPNPKLLDWQFFYFLMILMYKELRELSSGDGGRGGLNKHLLRNLIVQIPPTVGEQKAIAKVLSEMDEEIRLLSEERAKVERLKLGAMDDLLTGRVRLPLEEEGS